MFATDFNGVSSRFAYQNMMFRSDPGGTQRLAEIMIGRRSLTWAIMAAAAVSLLVYSFIVPWRICAVALGGYVALLLFERVAVDPRRPQWRPGLSLLCLAVQQLTLGAFAIVAVIYAYPVGLGLGMAHLGTAVLIAVVVSRASRAAFVANTAPHALYLIMGVPIALFWGHHVPLSQTLALGASGVLGSTVAVVFWLRHARLLRSEASAREQAQSASAAKSTFIATVSHELRTPIGAIQAGALELERVVADPVQRRHAALIVDAGRMMRTLLDDLLDMSKVEAGRMSVETIAFDVRSVVVDTVRFWQAEARKKGLRLTLTGARRLPRWVTGDPTRLRQVFNNLLSNAIKFTDAGRVSLNISSDGRLVCFCIADSGVGLSGEQIEGLFAPFAQADASITRTHGGTGLGLALSRDLSRLMGGDLTVDSVLGQGARFTVAIPLPAADPIEAPYDSGEPETADLPPLRVLAVDDHEINRRAMALILQPMGIEPTFAVDGATALEAVANEPFDVVLLDLHMPGIDGLEVARRVRRSRGPNRTTIILAVTGATEDRDRARCLEAGMNDCVAKPIEPAELHAALVRALASAADPQGARATGS